MGWEAGDWGLGARRRGIGAWGIGAGSRSGAPALSRGVVDCGQGDERTGVVLAARQAASLVLNFYSVKPKQQGPHTAALRAAPLGPEGRIPRRRRDPHRAEKGRKLTAAVEPIGGAICRKVKSSNKLKQAQTSSDLGFFAHSATRGARPGTRKATRLSPPGTPAGAVRVLVRRGAKKSGGLRVRRRPWRAPS